jgi:glutathione S-transferase
VHRTRVALEETNTSAELINIDLQNKPEWYQKEVNPLGKVPSLKLENGEILTESLVITQYIIEKYGADTGLIPQDPLARAKIRLFIEQFGTLIGSVYGIIAAKDAAQAEQARDKLLAAARQVNAFI